MIEEFPSTATAARRGLVWQNNPLFDRSHTGGPHSFDSQIFYLKNDRFFLSGKIIDLTISQRNDFFLP